MRRTAINRPRHVVRAACPHDCPYVRDAGQVRRDCGARATRCGAIEGDPEHPTPTAACAPRWRDLDALSPTGSDPLKRVGPKGSAASSAPRGSRRSTNRERLGRIAGRIPSDSPVQLCRHDGAVQRGDGQRLFNRLGASRLTARSARRPVPDPDLHAGRRWHRLEQIQTVG